MTKKIIAAVLVLVLTLGLSTVTFAGGGPIEMQLGIGVIQVTSQQGREIRIYSESTANISKLGIKDIKYSPEFDISIITFDMKIDILSVEASRGELSKDSAFCNGNVAYFIGNVKECTDLMVCSSDGFKYSFKNGKLQYMAIPIEQPVLFDYETGISE